MIASNLGFPRIGPARELKSLLETFWAGKIDSAELLSGARRLREQHWKTQQQLGLGSIPSNDFSLYDHILDTIAMVGAVPPRYKGADLSTYFAMARGRSDQPAMEMTKWFDTNYHYIVPEFDAPTRFSLTSTKPIDEFLEAKAQGILTRPVLVGPFSFLMLGKIKDATLSVLLDALLPVYEELLQRLEQAGADWIQMDEPCLVLDLQEETLPLINRVYERLVRVAPRLKILIATYFAGLGDSLEQIIKLPVHGVHLDWVQAPEQLAPALSYILPHQTLSLGVIDGRNIWRADLKRPLAAIRRAVEAIGPDRVQVAPSCSLLHLPVDIASETHLDPEIRSWLAFAHQKIEEVVFLAKAALQDDRAAHDDEAGEISKALSANQVIIESRTFSPRIHNPTVQARVIDKTMFRRENRYATRRKDQEATLGLPLFPTTTIGSFPQTEEVRKARAAFRAGKQTETEYRAFLEQTTTDAIRFQEEIGIDLLVHGEFERNDMVEYFGEQLEGFAFTQKGWVQSYGSRCVKPPIIYGDVARTGPMTVAWSRFAQAQTKAPVKGMLTGPVTILKWSFVRNDQPLSVTCHQIAYAIREEVMDLEAAGIRAIQIDEPALREGLPLKKNKWKEYLSWAVDAFRLATSGVADATQIHTHMCYADFNDILSAVADMDADVISMETSRSQMALLSALSQFQYPNEIGPGVYDIHSPRVPAIAEMQTLLEKAATVLPARQIWVNPDCGLKTRRWEEVRPALANMVAAARALRAAVQP